MGVDGMQAVGEMLAARARLNDGNQPRAGSMSANQKKTEATQNDESIDPVQVSSGVGCLPYFSKFKDYQRLVSVALLMFGGSVLVCVLVYREINGCVA